VKQAKHPSGEVITFTEEDHKYVDTKARTYVSATTFIHSLFTEFDTEGISARYAAKHGKNQDDVKREWEANKVQAAEYGTRVHAFAEAKLAGLALPEPTDGRDKKAFNAVAEYIDAELKDNFTIIEQEMIIFSPELCLAGTVDLLAKDKRGQLWVLDWKTNKEIKYNNRFQSGKNALKHLEDCNFNHYSLQLNLYRRLLHQEGYFRNAILAPMKLLHVGLGIRPRVSSITVPKMDAEIDYLLSLRKP
jgi:ATP-dependent exoDNAse (exonuclease V) beta subunit